MPGATTDSAVQDNVRSTVSARKENAGLPESASPGAGASGQEKPAAPGADAAGGEKPVKDYLGESLCCVARHYYQDMDFNEVYSGIVLKKNRLMPSNVEQAAKNIGLTSHIMKCDIEEIQNTMLPVVLFIKNNKSCVLVRKNGNTASIIDHDDNDNEHDINISNLKNFYTGYAVHIHPENVSKTSNQENVYVKSDNWLLSSMQKNMWQYVQVIFAAFILNVISLSSPLFVMNVYDRVVPNNAVETLTVLTIGVTTVFVFEFVIKTLRALFIDNTGKLVDIELENKFFDKILNMRLSDRPASVGAFANSLRELEVLREFFTSVTLVSFVDLPFVVIFISVIGIIGGPIALIYLISIPITIAIGIIMHFPIRNYITSSIAVGQNKNAVLIETLNNIETVKSLGCEAAMRHRWGTQSISSAKLATKSKFLSHLAVNITGMIHQLVYVTIIVIGVWLIKKGELSTGGLIACSMVGSRIMAPFMQIAQLITRLQHTFSAYKELSAIMAMPSERLRKIDYLNRPRVRGAIGFDRVGFAYANAAGQQLKDVSVSIKPGERVAIIGRTGSGKSTFGKLILGLYAPDEGTVLIDGADQRQYDPADLRRGIGYVPQDVELFRGTVRQNICVHAPEASDAEILRAATISGADEFIKLKKEGYGLQIGEHGSNLSGGQRQSIAIARAFVRNPNVFVLDEPTSFMDTMSEEIFMHRLASVIQNKTLVLITHRLSLLKIVDRIIVMDQGKIVEDGPKNVVLNKLFSNEIKTKPS